MWCTWDSRIEQPDGRCQLAEVTLGVLGDVSEESAKRDRDAGAADVADFGLGLIEGGNTGAGILEALLEENDQAEQGKVFGEFVREDGKLFGVQGLAFGVSEETVNGFGDVTNVKAGRSEAVGTRPELVAGETFGQCEDVFFGLLERAEKEMTEGIESDGLVS